MASRSVRRTGLPLLLFSIVAALALAADTTTPGGSISFYPADAARGKVLATQCIACHGIEGLKLGDPPVHVPMLGGQRPEAIFLALREYQKGTRTSPIMAPLVAGLSLQDMRDLGAYLSAGGPSMPQTHGQGSWAHEKVHRDCTSCHGESGMGVMPGVPVLTGQHQDYLVQALNDYRNGKRTDPTMAPIAARLTPQEIELLAEYFARHAHLAISK